MRRLVDVEAGKVRREPFSRNGSRSDGADSNLDDRRVVVGKDGQQAQGLGVARIRAEKSVEQRATDVWR